MTTHHPPPAVFHHFVSSCSWASPLIATCSAWHINCRASLIHRQFLIRHYLMLRYLLLHKNITPVLIIWLHGSNFQWSDATVKHWWLHRMYIRCLRAHRAPCGWCMGAIFVQKRWSRASLSFFFFFRGNSSCLAALIQAGCLYLHTYSNKEACTNSRKGSTFVFNRSLATELKQADATSYGWNLNRCRTRRFSHLTNDFKGLQPTIMLLFSQLISKPVRC